MPTIMSHAVVGVTLGSLTSFPIRRRAFWLASALPPVAPDLDVFGRLFGMTFYSPWGHRGRSHRWRPTSSASGAVRVFTAELAMIWLPAGLVALLARFCLRR